MAEKRKLSFKVKKENEFNEGVDSFKRYLKMKFKADVIKKIPQGKRWARTLKAKTPDLLASETLETAVKKSGLRKAIKDLVLE